MVVGVGVVGISVKGGPKNRVVVIETGIALLLVGQSSMSFRGCGIFYY